jgi:transcription initiation factor TFIID subunit 2
VIKLKVGSQNKVPERPQQTIKPPKRNPKLSDSPTNLILDAPPPPYVDDGSHDILQEVLAIEREKNEQRQRSVIEKEKPTANSIPGKRKKSDIIEEDDILALATPAKKERPSPPGPSSSIKINAVPPASIPKPPTVSVKPKNERPDTARPSTTLNSPLPSVKGKEREVASPTAAPVPIKPRKPVQATPINEKKCKDLLKVLQKLPDAAIFLRPVDSVLDGCPT